MFAAEVSIRFEVHPDEDGVTRVVTPLEYVGSGDKIVVRVRPDGHGYSIDDPRLI